MATLEQINALIVGNPALRQRFLAARAKAAWDVLNESEGYLDHANRLLWANSVLDSYEAHSQEEYMRFCSNTTIQGSGNDSTDNDIIYTVNTMLPAWVTTYVNGLESSSS